MHDEQSLGHTEILSDSWIDLESSNLLSLSLRKLLYKFWGLVQPNLLRTKFKESRIPEFIYLNLNLLKTNTGFWGFGEQYVTERSTLTKALTPPRSWALLVARAVRHGASPASAVVFRCRNMGKGLAVSCGAVRARPTPPTRWTPIPPPPPALRRPPRRLARPTPCSSAAQRSPRACCGSRTCARGRRQTRRWEAGAAHWCAQGGGGRGRRGGNGCRRGGGARHRGGPASGRLGAGWRDKLGAAAAWKQI